MLRSFFIYLYRKLRLCVEEADDAPDLRDLALPLGGQFIRRRFLQGSGTDKNRFDLQLE